MRSSWQALGVGVAGLLLVGCFQPVLEGGPDARSGIDASITLGPDGGSLSVLDASVWFQPGSLDSPVSPTLVPWLVEPPPGYRAIGPGWLASPEGLRFARAVTLTLPLNADAVVPDDPLFIFTAPLDRTSFELVGATRVDDSVVGFIWHFSVLLPVTPLRRDAGVPDGGKVDAGTQDAGPSAVPFDGGCRGSPDWAAVRCGVPTSSTDGGACTLTAACEGADRTVQCERGQCECRIGNAVVNAVTGFTGSCFGAWNCVCGFPSLCVSRGTEAPRGARPGVGDYSVGMRCVDHYDCREDLCWNSGTWNCATSCRSGSEPRCPCGQTCQGFLGAELCFEQ